MARYLVPLLVALTSAGCNVLTPLPHDIYIDDRFSDMEKQFINEAIRETNEALIRPCIGHDGLINMRYVVIEDGFAADGSDMGDDMHVIYKLYTNEPAYDKLQDLAERDFGGYATIQDVIMIKNLDNVPLIEEMIAETEADPDLDWNVELQEKLEKLYEFLKEHKAVFKRIIRHELGHHVGLLHNPNPDALMFSGAKTATTFTELDKEAFALVRGCSYD